MTESTERTLFKHLVDYGFQERNAKVIELVYHRFGRKAAWKLLRGWDAGSEHDHVGELKRLVKQWEAERKREKKKTEEEGETENSEGDRWEWPFPEKFAAGGCPKCEGASMVAGAQNWLSVFEYEVLTECLDCGRVFRDVYRIRSRQEVERRDGPEM